MGDNTIQTINFELLGRVLDGRATSKERKTVLLEMSNSVFMEYFMVALKVATLYNEKNKVYGKIQ